MNALRDIRNHIKYSVGQREKEKKAGTLIWASRRLRERVYWSAPVAASKRTPAQYYNQPQSQLAVIPLQRRKRNGIRNTDYDIVTVPFGSPHPFPNHHLLGNKLLLGYPHVLSAQLEFCSPPFPLFFRPVSFYQFGHINIVSLVYF